MGDPPTVSRLTARGRATRARIVEAAATLMSEHGVAGTSIDDVRKLARVSGSQMTHYFDNKRSLIRAVIAREAQQVLDDTSHQIETLRDLREWVRDIAGGLHTTSSAGCCRLGSLAGEVAELDPDTRAAVATGFERWELSLRATLGVMRERRQLRADADPAEMALALLCALHGGMLLARTKRSRKPIDAALSMVLNYIESFALDQRTRAERSGPATGVDRSDAGQ